MPFQNQFRQSFNQSVENRVLNTHGRWHYHAVFQVRFVDIFLQSVIVSSLSVCFCTLNFQVVCSFIKISSIIRQVQSVVILLKHLTTLLCHIQRVGNRGDLRVYELDSADVKVIFLFKSHVDIDFAEHVHKVLRLMLVLMFVFQRYNRTLFVDEFNLSGTEFFRYGVQVVYHEGITDFGVIIIPLIRVFQLYLKPHAVFGKPFAILQCDIPFYYTCGFLQQFILCIIINRHIVFRTV